MEPQGAVVLPDEDGTFTVTSSTQNIDAVQKAVADVLGQPMHKITAGLLMVSPLFLWPTLTCLCSKKKKWWEKRTK